MKKEAEDAEEKFQKEKAEHELKMQMEREAHEQLMKEKEEEMERSFKRREENLQRQLTKSNRERTEAKQAQKDAEAGRDQLQTEQDQLQSKLNDLQAEVLRLQEIETDYNSATTILGTVPDALTSALPFSSSSTSSLGPLSSTASNVASNAQEIYRYVGGEAAKYNAETSALKQELRQVERKLRKAQAGYKRVKRREKTLLLGRDSGVGTGVSGTSSDAINGYLSSSDMSISDGEDDDSADDSASTAVGPVVQPNREVSHSNVAAAVSPVPTSSGTEPGATLTDGDSAGEGRAAVEAVAAAAAKAEKQRRRRLAWQEKVARDAAEAEKSAMPQPQREGSSIASPQQRKKRKQAASTDLASAQAQLTVFTRTPGPSLVSGRVIPGPRSYSSSEA